MTGNDGFTNSIVSGNGTLVRDAIRSPNYQPGVSGWSINKDGSAEFQDLTARGDISGSTFTIPAGAGATDARIVIDNSGINVYRTGGALVATISNDDAPGFPVPIRSDLFTSENGGLLPGDSWQLVPSVDPLTPATFDWQIGHGITFVNNTATQTINRYQFGLGFNGASYSQEWDAAAQVINNSALTKLINLVNTDTHSDYGNAMNVATGVWTCPETSRYDMTMHVAYTAWVANSRGLLRIQDATNSSNIFGNQDFAVASSGGQTLAISKTFTKGDTVTFNVLQVNGAARTVDNTVSYVSIGRAL